MDIFKCALQHFVGDFARLLYGAVHNLFNVTSSIDRCPQNRMSDARPQHRELHAYSLRLVCGFFNVPQLFKVVRRDLRLIVVTREDLKVWCNYKGSTFSSVILRPWVLVRSESNPWPPASQPDAQQLSHQCAVGAVARKHFLLSYFKTLSVGPVGVELTTSRHSPMLNNWATSAQLRQGVF